jgi:hypothetical protein
VPFVHDLLNAAPSTAPVGTLDSHLAHKGFASPSRGKGGTAISNDA